MFPSGSGSHSLRNVVHTLTYRIHYTKCPEQEKLCRRREMFEKLDAAVLGRTVLAPMISLLDFSSSFKAAAPFLLSAIVNTSPTLDQKYVNPKNAASFLKDTGLMDQLEAAWKIQSFANICTRVRPHILFFHSTLLTLHLRVVFVSLSSYDYEESQPHMAVSMSPAQCKYNANMLPLHKFCRNKENNLNSTP